MVWVRILQVRLLGLEVADTGDGSLRGGRGQLQVSGGECPVFTRTTRMRSCELH